MATIHTTPDLITSPKMTELQDYRKSIEEITLQLPDLTLRNTNLTTLGDIQDKIAKIDEQATLELTQEIQTVKRAVSFLMNIYKDYEHSDTPINPRVQSIGLALLNGNDWGEKNFLGQGACGKVYSLIAPDGLPCAIKISNSADKSFHEAHIHKQLVHPNIIRYIGKINELTILMDFSFDPKSYSQFLKLFQPFNSNLKTAQKELLKKCSVLNSDIPRPYLKQLIEALIYINSLGIYHGDVKPLNTIIDKNNNLKCIDFDLSNLSGNTFVDGGTPPYQAPEVPTSPEQYITKPFSTIALDAFAIGKMIKQMYSFDRFDIPAEVISHMSDALDLSCKLTQNIPDQRFTLRQTLEHSYFS